MISLNGFEENCITLKVDNTCKVGEPVEFTKNHEATYTEGGNPFIGILKNEKNGYGAVQVKGYFKLPYLSDGLHLGYCPIINTGAKSVAYHEDGRMCIVVAIDEENHIVEFIA